MVKTLNRPTLEQLDEHAKHLRIYPDYEYRVYFRVDEGLFETFFRKCFPIEPVDTRDYTLFATRRVGAPPSPLILPSPSHPSISWATRFCE